MTVTNIHLKNGLWLKQLLKAKENAAAIQDLILWSEIASLGREAQKNYILYGNVPSSFCYLIMKLLSLFWT
jgi:hypothetical protein